ncbi:hypothetical protein AO067_10230 [Pseudomonas viridiflava ICMP 13104]|uniref:Uncharacterized protein n=1 Tax=Pseudomonas viridiflava ICMP 13104 TaxID=1198305 RepID=A0A0W0IBI2_PSEVI|nr:hypothetical protein AO067_10230 [Pseudomonas viridiflava ICMP 13104]
MQNLFGKEMRKVLLEFLRNITPQVLLFTLTLVLSMQLNLGRWDISWAGFIRIVPFLLCSIITVLAVLANIFNLVSDAVDIMESSTQASGRTSRTAKMLGCGFIIFIIQAGIAAPMIMGGAGALNFMTTTHKLER